MFQHLKHMMQGSTVEQMDFKEKYISRHSITFLTIKVRLCNFWGRKQKKIYRNVIFVFYILQET